MRRAIFVVTLMLLVVSCGESGPLTIEEIPADTGCSGTGTIEISPSGQTRTIDDVQYELPSGGFPTPWCEGIVHRWAPGGGTLPVLTDDGEVSYRFDSDAADPLEFAVTEAGYEYRAGSGSVTMPGGEVVTLP